jgi:N-acetylmuramoyl-L-alanine amidase
MDNTAAPQESTSQSPSILKSTFSFIQVVILVALLVATLFTAWSDPGLMPVSLGDKLSFGTGPQVTQVPGASSAGIQSTTPRIGIVAGHSGNDSGAVCPDGLTERSVNETIAAYVQQNLAEMGYNVDVLQEFDPLLTGYLASALVSIHTDSCDYVNDQATGFKVSSALANPHPERAARLTACLRNRYGQVTGLPLHNSITIDMTSYHAFEEVDDNTTAAIIEVGFLNLDRQLLTQQPDLIAKGVTDGIICFLKNENISQPTPQ